MRYILSLTMMTVFVVSAADVHALDGFAQAQELLDDAGTTGAKSAESGAMSQGGSFEGIAGLIGDLATGVRPKTVPRSRDLVKKVHDYTVCNGPQCFTCTHLKVEKCDQKDVKICIGIEDGKPVCRWETTFTNCRLVDGGHTCH